MLLLLALASGAALLAVVAWSLVQSAAAAREREELAARRDAKDLAVALRAALRQPAVLGLVDAELRFEVHEGRVRVDDEVGWLTAREAPPTEPGTFERLRQAMITEFAAHDAATATRLHDELLAAPEAVEQARWPVLAAAAWQAHRGHDATRRDALAAELAQQLTALSPSNLADARAATAVTSLALLAAAGQQPMPAVCSTLLPAAPAALAAATFARLRERGVEVGALVSTHARVADRRELLRDAAAALGDVPRHASARLLGARLLLWFPDDETPNSGRGALVPTAWLRTLPGLGTRRASTVDALPPIPDRGTLHFADASTTLPPDAEDVLPGACWVTPLPLPTAPWFAGPIAMLVAASTLVLVFAGSAVAMWRALRREAEALRARSEFLTGVTHELKTPVASMRLVAEVLRDDDVPPARQREYVALLAGEATRLAGLVDNVLDLGQMERGERAYDRQPGDLAVVVRDVVAAFAPLAQRGGLAVSLTEGIEHAPALVDGNALTQALLNVLENARKYASRGGRLELTTTRTAAMFRVTVRDFGPGVPSAERETIFVRFQRGTAHRHGSIPGVGLGLHLARTIVVQHGGSLHCEAPPEGPGACFVFTLPLLESPA